MVLASRETPKLPLARMRAQDQVFEIGAKELRFSLAETERFLKANGASPWQSDNLAHLYERTEGWAAGLKLTLLALGGREDLRGLVGSSSGTFAEIEDYLLEEVLSRQPKEVRDFLLKTSILERLTGSLCEAVTGTEGGYDMLEHLRQANLFITPLDPERRWYRYDHLFAQFLQSRLERDYPGRTAQLHMSAANWLEEKGAYESAAEHALMAGDAEGAVRLMARGAGALVRLGQMDTVLRWGERLPRGAIEQEPELWVAHCWALVFRRRDFEAARVSIAELCEAVEGMEGSAVRDEALALQGVALSFEERYEEAYRVCSENLAKISDRRSFAFAVLSEALAVCLMSTGRFDEAEECLLEARGDQDDAGPTLAEVYSDSQRVVLRILRGRHREALSLGRSLHSRTEETFPPHSLPRVVSAHALASALYESDELEEAEALLADDLRVVSEYSLGWIAAESYRTLSRIYRAQGREEEARLLLEKADQLGRVSGASFFCAGARLERAFVALHHGDAAEAERLLASLREHASPRAGLIFLDPQPEVLTWRLRIAKGEGEAVLTELRSALPKAESQGRIRLALILRLLQARALEACGRRRPALRSLRRALQAGYQEGLVRTFADEGPAVIELMRIIRDMHWDNTDQSSRDLPASYLDRILSATGCSAEALEPKTLSAATSDSPIALTPRELEVLRLSGLGLSHQAVADHLFVSVKTVDFHMGNIFAKLGVAGRTEALLKARRAGLIA